MPRATEPRPLTKTEARRIWLHAQRLDTNEPFGAGPQAVAAAVDHLGYVQIDTINVIERSHHHILWNRIPEYRRADLRQAQSVDRSAGAAAGVLYRRAHDLGAQRHAQDL